MHTDNKGKKSILVLGKDLTQGCSINFSRSKRKFCLNLHYKGSNSFLFANASKIYQFKAKKSKKNHICCV